MVGFTLPLGQQLVGQALANDSFMFLKAVRASIEKNQNGSLCKTVIYKHVLVPKGELKEGLE